MQALFRALDVASVFYRRQLLNSRRSWATDLMEGRQLGAVLDPASTWAVGYSSDRWSRLVDHLRSAGFDDETMIAAGVAIRTARSGRLVDRFRDRLIFVAHDLDLRPVGLVARARAAEPKYLNSPGTQIYTKGRSLVGLDAQVDRLAAGAIPVLVEGPTDAVAVSLLGDEWAGASSCGTAVTRYQAAIVRRHAVGDTAIIMLDADQGGRQGTVRGIDALSGYFRSVLVAELPDGEDPASLFRSSPELLRGALGAARPGQEFAIDVELARWDKVLDHLSGQVGALRSVAPLVVKLPSDRIAGQVAWLARRLRLEEHVVSREVLACSGRRPSVRGSDRDLETHPDLNSRTP